MLIAGFALAILPVGQVLRTFTSRPVSPYLAILAFGLAIVVEIQLLQGGPRETVFNAISFDPLAIFFSIIFLIVGILVAITSIDYMAENKNQDSYYSLLLLSTLGMMLVSSSVDLIVLYASWELMNLSTYTLTCIRKGDPISNEAAVKLFLLSALSSAIILYGISILFGVTGSTNVYAIAKVLTERQAVFHPLTLFAVVLFAAGFGFKMAAVPFHMWIPDVYEGAPTTISALLASATKNAGFAAAIRVFAVAMIGLRLDWTSTLAILALVTMTWGNIAALMQKSMVRLLAYSSIAQAGYMLIGLAAPNPMGIMGLAYHALNLGVMKTAAFIAAAAVIHKLARDNLDSYGGLGGRMPVTSFNLTVSLLALAGVPPLNGFVSKLVLFTAAIDGGMAWLAVAGVLNSAFSLAYYGWVIKRMYFDESTDTGSVQEPLSFKVALIISTIVIVVTGVFPEVILKVASTLASSL